MDVFWTIFLFLIGACVGSFLNVVIYRLPRGESIVFPGSHCPRCGRAIKWYDNIPLLSWVLLRGRCRFCRGAISPRYVLIELATAVLVSGLYVCYYVLEMREGAGDFADTWPMFAAHAALLCGLLAAAAVDIDLFIVPLEVCWVVSVLGLVAAAFRPHPWLPQVSATTAGMTVAAAVGLGVSLLLMRYGVIQQSFIDASDKAPAQPSPRQDKKGKQRPISVAVTKAHGVDPRKEVLREVLFLLPPVLAALAAYALVTLVAPLEEAWNRVASADAGWPGPHVNALLSAAFGYFVGAAWIWGVRILGTLAFGKEAMGMGDVHILGAVGAVTGWIVPSLVFFVAPFFGLVWALLLLVRRNQRELPYGPWLAVATLAVMLFYDAFAGFLQPYFDAMSFSLR